jgi:hypothetical protein
MFVAGVAISSHQCKSISHPTYEMGINGVLNIEINSGFLANHPLPPSLKMEGDGSTNIDSPRVGFPSCKGGDQGVGL